MIEDRLLNLTLLLAYGPFGLMLLIFILARVMKWFGRPDFLRWLIKRTDAQQPLPRKADPSHSH